MGRTEGRIEGTLYRRRRWVDKVMIGICIGCIAVSVLPLLSIIAYTVTQGMGALNWSFLTNLPAPIGTSGGGMANSMVGSTIVVGMAGLIGIPVGTLAGVYLAEYGRSTLLGTTVRLLADVMQGIPVGTLAGVYLAEYGRSTLLGTTVRLLADVMQGIPSIVVGIVAYTVVVLPMQRFSAIAGAVALAMMLIPFVARTTEEAIRTAPEDIREAGIALGQPRDERTRSYISGHLP